MKILLVLWTSISNFFSELVELLSGTDRDAALEAYLSGATSFADLESRERQWIRSH